MWNKGFGCTSTCDSSFFEKIQKMPETRAVQGFWRVPQLVTQLESQKKMSHKKFLSYKQIKARWSKKKPQLHELWLWGYFAI
jgi:hypothetical protein